MLATWLLFFSLAPSIALASALATSADIVRRYGNDDSPPPFRVHPIHSIPIINGITACEQLQTSIPLLLASHGDEPMNITNVISLVYPEGVNPTTKELFNSIPSAILQPSENIAGAISSVGEWNKSEVISDYGYGEQDDVQTVDGGLPSFCRFGASITTSNMSSVWFETWMPLPRDISSSSVTTTSTNSTSTNATSLWEHHHHRSNQIGRAPRDNWRGRLVFVGNNGQSGGVFYPEMKQVLTRYRESTASTNGGHFGSASLSNWTIDNPESQLDFGRRGVHVSSVASQVVVKTFYGIRDRRTKHGHKRVGFNTYFKGCSTGGRQGMGEAQNYPKDYDGIMAGSPAVYYNDLNAYQIHVNSLQNDTMSPSFIPITLYPVIHQHIINECDLNDGVRDAVIQNPATCHPKLYKLLCPSTNATNFTTTPSSTVTDATSAIIASSANSTTSTNSTTCLTQPQLDNLYNIYKPLRYPDGTIIHEPVLYGSEFSWTVTDGVVGRPFPPAPGWFQYQVLGLNTSVSSFNPDTVVEGNFSLIELGNKLNPGHTNTANPDLSRYFARGSKLIHYHGTADQLIPSGSSDRYFKRVHQETTVKEGELSDYYRYFHIPGMAHCRGGDGAWNFGGAGQTSTPGSRPLEYNAKHDALLALFKWTEYDIAPSYIIGAAYKSNFTETSYTIGNTTDLTPYSNGVKFSHKLCPYPKQAVLIDQDNPYNSSSLHCQHL